MNARWQRSLWIVSAFLFCMTANAAQLERPIRANAGSCSTVRINGCDVDVRGSLETGDCQPSSGGRIDYFEFQGTAGQIVSIMVRPLSPTYKRPSIALFSPLGDPADPPVVAGGNADAAEGGAEILYQLSSTGTWEIAVSSVDLFASGDYVLHLGCFVDDTPGGPQSCIEQYLLCGQTANWELSADSCRFAGAGAYAAWYVYGVKGDLLEFEQEAFGFTPLFGIYDDDGRLLRSSTRTSSVRANMSFVVPSTGWYHFLTTSEENNRGGFFTVGLKCRNSGCTFPYLLSPIPNVTVKRGEQAVIPFTVNALGGFSTTLRNFDLIPVATVPTRTTSITTPPVFGRTSYTLQFENACGDWISNEFTVSPEATRRRAIRK